MKKSIIQLTLLSSLYLGLQGTAHALGCDDIMNLVKYSVPTSSIIQTMKGSRFTQEEIQCLVSKGAPPEIIEQAKSQSDAVQAPESRPDPSERSLDDINDFGTGSSSRGFEDEDRGLDGNMPREIQEAKKNLQSKRAATAAYNLNQLLKDNTYPDRKSEVEYYYARALTDLGMYHSAQTFYLKVVQTGPSSQYFSSALAKLVSIARLTGDDYDLKLAIVKNRIAPNLFPRKAKSHLHYLLGVLYYDAGELALAQSNFEKVSPDSVLYLKARYIEGVIYSEQEKLKSAVRAFRDVYKERDIIEPGDEREREIIDDLTDLALLNIASIYFSLGEDKSYEESSSYFTKVNHDSQYWPEALFRDAWAQFHLGRYDETLGRLLTLDSPYFDEEQFIPEADILKAITYYSVCDYSRVGKIIEDFESQYVPMKSEIEEQMAKYRSDEYKKMTADIWRHYFNTDTKVDTALNKSFFNRVFRNQELTGIARHLSMMEQERVRISEQNPTWKKDVGDDLLKTIAEDEQRYQKRAGKLLLKEMKTQRDTLNYLANQASFIKLDLSEQKIKEYKKRANVDSLNFEDKFKVNFATSASFIYWPFNGEFWADELGYYKIKHGSCK